MESLCKAFLAETVERIAKNRCVIEATPVLRRMLRERLNSELFRNVSVHEFYRLKAFITLERVNTITKIRCSGVVNFDCMQMTLL